MNKVEMLNQLESLERSIRELRWKICSVVKLRHGSKNASTKYNTNHPLSGGMTCNKLSMV